MRALILVPLALFAVVLTVGAAQKDWAADLLNIDLFTAGNAPTPTIGSVIIQDGEDSSTADFERINRALIEYGALEGLRQHGYENLVVVSSPEAWDDPHLVTMLLAEREGWSVTSAITRQPYVYSAMMLANMGFLGGDTGNADLYSGPPSEDARLVLIQQFMDDTMQPGTSVEPGSVYAAVYRRVQNTDSDDMITGRDDPGYPYNQIAITNSALITVSPYVTEDSQRHLVLQLSNAEDDYLIALAKGEMTMTYPEYLTSIKAQRWLPRP